tara:strand:+ start:1680 stop:1895 length:216 start_codon:yes stop_codon:yes gene_type:complete
LTFGGKKPRLEIMARNLIRGLAGTFRVTAQKDDVSVPAATQIDGKVREEVCKVKKKIYKNNPLKSISYNNI